MAEVITNSNDTAETNSGLIVMKLNNVTDEELRGLNENLNIKFKHCTVLKQFEWFHQFHSKKCSRDGYHTQSKEYRKSIDEQSIEREVKRQRIILVNGEPTMCEELSLPELKALQKQHNIILEKNYNRKELVELLKQRGVLHPDYTIGRRRVKNKKLVSDKLDEAKTVKHMPREHMRRVELTLVDDETSDSHLFPSLYKAAKFLGTFSSFQLSFNMRYYKSKIDGKTYRVSILDPHMHHHKLIFLSRN
jgi:hypothetical protein